MEVLVASHPSALAHDTGPGHPEAPQRVQSVLRGILSSGVRARDLDSPPLSRTDLERIHSGAYIDMIQDLCELGGGALDMDTVVSHASWEAALTAAGGVSALMKQLESETDMFGFALTRPPGHHAGRDRARGFCIFNNVALAASVRRARGERVAILDWDVHHGDGTQEILAADEGSLYVSLHQEHHYPLTGLVSDIDAAPGATVVNVPLPAGTAGDVYRRAWAEIVLPVLAEFAPDWVLVSSGYDAHRADPLADMALEADDYGWMAAELAGVFPASRTVVALEGGYDAAALEDSARATVQGLARVGTGWADPPLSPPGSSRALADAWAAARRHWSI